MDIGSNGHNHSRSYKEVHRFSLNHFQFHNTNQAHSIRESKIYRNIQLLEISHTSVFCSLCSIAIYLILQIITFLFVSIIFFMIYFNRIFAKNERLSFLTSLRTSRSLASPMQTLPTHMGRSFAQQLLFTSPQSQPQQDEPIEAYHCLSSVALPFTDTRGPRFCPTRGRSR
jgi:hypothetical protein